MMYFMELAVQNLRREESHLRTETKQNLLNHLYLCSHPMMHVMVLPCVCVCVFVCLFLCLRVYAEPYLYSSVFSLVRIKRLLQ